MSEINILSKVVQSPNLRLPHRRELHEPIRMPRDWSNSLAHYSPIRRVKVDRLFEAEESAVTMLWCRHGNGPPRFSGKRGAQAVCELDLLVTKDLLCAGPIPLGGNAT